MRYPVPYGLDVSVEIRRGDDIASVHVHSPMYMCTEWSPTFGYSTEFTDMEILKDPYLVKALINAYG